jgi:signal transduction histidine kinase
MPFVRKSSVRVQLTVIILVAIVSSWLLSAGLSNYLLYQRIRSLRQEMLQHPDLYPRPIPEPQFGLKGFFFGPRGLMPKRMDTHRPPGSPENLPPRFGEPNQGQPPPGPPPEPSNSWISGFVLSHAGIALALALLAGTWLSYRFTRPLGELIKGAMAFQSGNLDYRVPLKGESDFTRVALAMNRMAERLRSQIKELELDAERRKQLLADVAHELRSPVMTMQTMCSAMASGLAEHPERKQQALSSLVRASERLTHLVNDLIELAKLDLQELPIHLQEVDLRELLKSVLQNHVAAAKQEQVILHELAEGPAVTLSADPDRLTQIMDNLLNNAIHHAGAGSIIQVSIEAGDPVQIKVADSGKGIDPRHLPYLFDPFYRVDQVRTPGDPHSGLGLRIARGLAEAHQGQLSLTSTLGQGTTVVVSLPRSRRSWAVHL